MPAPPAILDLVQRFERNREAYHSGTYKETQLRREFIDPFFETLGWDIFNKQGFAEPYKDVIHEDAIKIGGITKAPDYCFRIGGILFNCFSVASSIQVYKKSKRNICCRIRFPQRRPLWAFYISGSG